MTKVKNMEKYHQYKSVMELAKDAMDKKMYLAVILLDYALIEDRLTSLLDNIGVLTDTKQQLKKSIKDVITVPKANEQHYMSMSKKIANAKAIIRWHNEVKRPLEKVHQERDLWLNRLDSVNCTLLLEALTKLDDWRKRRNNIIHALMGTSKDVNGTEIQEMATQGLELFRNIDKEISRLKRNKEKSKHKNVRRPVKEQIKTIEGE